MGNFHYDLERAKQREVFVGAFLLNHFEASGYYQTSGNNPAYDYEMVKNDVSRTFEQKTDYYTKPNHQKIFVEVASANRQCPAGIPVSSADYIVYDLPNFGCVCLFKAEPFKQYVLVNSGEYRYYPNAGDGSRGFVVPLAITGQVPCRVIQLDQGK